MADDIDSGWEDYWQHVLGKRVEHDAEVARLCRMVFYAGAMSATMLIGTGQASPLDLRDELRRHANDFLPERPN